MIKWITLIFTIAGSLGIGTWWVKRWERKKEVEEKVREQIWEMKKLKPQSDKESRKNLLKLGEEAVNPIKEEMEKIDNSRLELKLSKILYELGDEEAKDLLTSEMEDTVKRETNPQNFEDAARIIQDLKMKQLGDVLLERLKDEENENIIYVINRTLGKLRHREALNEVMSIFETALEERKNKLIRSCIMSTEGILEEHIDDIGKSSFNKILELYSKVLEGEDEWSIDAVVRCSLPIILKRKQDLRGDLQDQLFENLLDLLNYEKADIRKETVQRLADLEDRRAISKLKEMNKEINENAAIKPIVENALKRLEIKNKPS